MGVISTGSHPKAFWPGVKMWWGRSYEEHQEKYTKLFDKDTSKQNYEEMVEVTGFGLAPEKSEGRSTIYDSESQGVVNRGINVAYSLGYIVTKEENDDNLYEMVSKRRVQALAFSMRQTQEITAANFYNRAFSGSYTFGDGKALLANDHPVASGGTQSNILAVAADFSESSLEDLTIQMKDAKNSRGLNINPMPKMLVGPTAYTYEFKRVLGSALQNDTANNALNALRAEGTIPDYTINPYLTDSDAWFIRSSVPGGLTCYSRIPITFGQDVDFDTDNLKAKAYQRYMYMFGDWRTLYGSAGA